MMKLYNYIPILSAYKVLFFFCLNSHSAKTQVRSFPYAYNVMSDTEDWSFALQYAFPNTIDETLPEYQESGILAAYVRHRIINDLTASLNGGMSYGTTKVRHFGITLDQVLHDPAIWTISATSGFYFSNSISERTNLKDSRSRDFSLGIAADWSPVRDIASLKLFLAPRYTNRISKYKGEKTTQGGFESTIGLSGHLARFGFTLAYNIQDFKDKSIDNQILSSGKSRFGIMLFTSL